VQSMQPIIDAINSGEATSDDFAGLEVPEAYTGALLRQEDETMFEGVPTRDRDPRKSLRIEDVPVPEVGPGEALIAVMASSINYNTVWSSIFEPVSTFGFLRRYGRTSPLAKRHDLPYHVLGSDLSGVVLRTGPGVHAWHPGDEVVAHCASVELESPLGHNDTMLDPEQRIWGFETNFGGLAQLALVKSNQLLEKPAHLNWEEAASPGLVNSTAYRQLVSQNGAGMKQGDIVLIWGASGGLGSYATQMALNGGATPVCVVSSPEKADIVRSMGASSTAMPRTTGSGRTSRPRTRRSGSGSAARSASSPAGTMSTSCSSTLDVRRSAPVSTWHARAARSSRAPRHRASCMSTTTASSG
jgi:crotonyl-CoA reductase